MMKKYPALLLALAIVLCFFSCKRSGSGSQAPEITLQGMSKDSVYNGEADDTIVLQIYIRDENGDLVSNDDAFFMDDLRDTADFLPYAFPRLDDAVLNNPNGIEGNIFFFITGDRTLVREDSLHQAVGDTVQYRIYVKDVAGNESERITLPPIYIRP